jgi:hypothetical protein
MYDLPDNATAAQIIRRSVVCHPSLFAEALQSATDTHRAAAALMTNHQSRNVALKLEGACRSMKNWIACGEYEPDDTVASIMAGSFDYWISALNIAARLQCLPRHLVSAAVGPDVI